MGRGWKLGRLEAKSEREELLCSVMHRLAFTERRWLTSPRVTRKSPMPVTHVRRAFKFSSFPYQTKLDSQSATTMSAFKCSTIPIKPFRISHSPNEIDSLKTLLRLSPLGPDTFENGANRPANMGIDMRSMRKIREDWLAYDWFKTQDELNALPQFMAQVQDKDPKTGKEREFDIHFIGYESGKADAIPVLLLHGWPGMGCFELAPMVEHLQKNAKQPLDIIIPRYVWHYRVSPTVMTRD